MSIPASKLVSIVPSAIGTGGNQLALNTVLILGGTSGRTIGAQIFGGVDEVGAYYGLASKEYEFAKPYFLGYDGSTRKPSALIMAQHHAAETSAILRGASVRGLSLDALKAIAGSLTIVIDGTPKTGEVDLSGVTSFSQAAQTIATALTAVVEFNEQLQAFEVASDTKGKASTIAYASGVAAPLLRLGKASGARIENGSEVLSPDEFMAKVMAQTLNFGLFTHLDEVSRDVKEVFAKWNTAQDSRFMYVAQDYSLAALIANNDASFGAWLKLTEQNGTMPYYGTIDKVAFLCGAVASIDFKRENGRRNIMFTKQAGLSADVDDSTDYTALISNGYTFYGAFATANDRFQFTTNGAVSGQFKWADNYVNQIYLNAQLQLAFVVMLESYGSIPYNSVGEAYQRSAAQDPINEGINFGSIRALDNPSDLSEQQRSIINSQAGQDIIPELINKGYFLKIWAADAQTRGQRGSRPATLWYTDGGSVQSVNLASINVQ